MKKLITLNNSLKEEYSLLQAKQKELVRRLEAKRNKVEQLQHSVNSKHSIRREAYEFFDFLGFTNKTTKEEVIALLGPGDKTNHDNLVGLTYGGRLRLVFHEKSLKLESTYISTFLDDDYGKQYIKNLGLYDYRIEFLGKSNKEIIETFGKPLADDDPVTYTYQYMQTSISFDFIDRDSYAECYCISVWY